VDVVGLEEHGFANLEFDVVEKEADKETNVVGELSVEAHHQISKLLAIVGRAALACEFGAFLLRLLDQCWSCFVDVFLGGFHKRGECSLERLLVLGSLSLIFGCLLSLDGLFKLAGCFLADKLS
jgi:hypothetical protein